MKVLIYIYLILILLKLTLLSNANNQTSVNSANKNTSSISSSTNLLYDYDFYNINSSYPYKLMNIPKNSNYNSSNTCVSYPDLINYNYTVSFRQFDYSNKIFPENFCYGLLTYNISRNDFFNIIEKNKSKI